MNNVILVGMPGAGKSTIGVQLAKELALDFVDTDVLIQVREGKSLQDIMDQSDYMNLRAIEEQVLLETDFSDHVVATGGSVVYSDKGMRHIKRNSTVVYLDVSLKELKARIHNYESRGIAMRPDQTFQDLFDERRDLYQQYADLVIDCNHKNQEAVLIEVLQRLQEK